MEKPMTRLLLKPIAMALLASTIVVSVPAMAQEAADPTKPRLLKNGEAADNAETPVQDHKSASDEKAPGTASSAEDTAEAEDQQAKPAPNAATEAAPGQLQQQDEVDSAREAAPGQQQQSGEVEDAKDAAPGQVKEEQASDTPSDETTASIDLSSEQQVELRDAFAEVEIEPISIELEVDVGATVPETVVLNPLPPRIVEIVPKYAGYQYFVLADGRIIIVEPATYEVVYILTS